MKPFAVLGALVLFPYLLLEAVALWKDDLPEISIFNRRINLKKIFRIDREMLGDHRKPYGAFRLCLVFGMITLFIGVVLKNLLFNIGFIVSGLSFVVYGVYGIYKKEITDVTGSRDYGVKARIMALLFIILGGVLLACGFYFI